MNRGKQESGLHSGVQHWKVQRVSSILLIPLTLWLLWAIVSLAGADYTSAREFFGNPLHVSMAVLMSGVMFYHAQLGIQVVCEDYVYPPRLSSALIWLTRIACLGGFIATLYAMFAVSPGA
jgi:succinate dehydrogenase / fumarate reductase membrane anchor subunit